LQDPNELQKYEIFLKESSTWKLSLTTSLAAHRAGSSDCFAGAAAARKLALTVLVEAYCAQQLCSWMSETLAAPRG
jgi:hypothetical protein